MRRPTLSPVSRRRFLETTAGAAALMTAQPWSNAATPSPIPPCAVFSKIFQEIKLSLEDTAAATAEAGFDGIDCPARPGGQVLPERAADDLPRLAEILKGKGLKLHLLTTGILGVESPHAESLLRTAAKLGVKHYRLGYWKYQRDQSLEARLAEIRAQLKDLAALNKELGLCALLQNHAGADQVGAKVRDLWEVAREFDPRQIALAFDPGHAINVLGEGWREEFERARSHFAIAYVKDWKTGEGWVPFGRGGLGASGFFKLLKSAKYSAPFSVHLEYKWAANEQAETRSNLVEALRADLKVLKQWWAEA